MTSTLTSACSERRRGSMKLGKYEPRRIFGIASSISPARVDHARDR
jgi:hypothetical protein